MIRDTFNRVTGLGATTRALCMPWLLLIARIWFGQVVLVHQIMTMVEGDHAGVRFASLHVPSGGEAAVRVVMPVLLSTGLLTRPIALVFLLETVGGEFGAMNSSALGAKVALLAWLVVSGPGTLSFDSLLARGLRWVPFGALRFMRRLYGWLDRNAAPLMQFAIRACLAMSLMAFAAPTLSWAAPMMFGGSVTALAWPAWFAVTIAVALVLGIGTRFAALAVASTIPTIGIAMSMDDRLAVLLLLLVIVAAGAGALSADRLLDKWMRVMAQRKRPSQETLPHVVVVGGGFGGVAVVRGLSGLPCRVTLIDQRNHHLFQPLLYQVATAALSPAEIATPIRSLFRRQRNVRVQLGEVTGVDIATREVMVGTDRTQFDYLVLATGARHSYFGKDGWAPFAPGLKRIEDATSIRSRLLKAFEEAENAADEAERAAWMTFVIVGGGPTGIELAGAISELARHGMDDEYRTIDPCRCTRDPAAVWPTCAAHVFSGILRGGGTCTRVARRRSSSALQSYVGGQCGGGCRRTTNSGADRSVGGRCCRFSGGSMARAEHRSVRTDPCGYGPFGSGERRGVFAIGDTALSLGWRGSPVPGLAPAAKQQGRYVARAIGGRSEEPPRATSIPLSAFRQSRDDRTPGGYRRDGWLAFVGRTGMVVLGRGAYPVPGWRAQPDDRHSRLDMGLPYVSAEHAAHHGCKPGGAAHALVIAPTGNLAPTS